MTHPDSTTDFDVAAVRDYLLGLQDSICDALEAFEPSARFDRREMPGERGGTARPRVLSEGEVVEKAAVNFSHTVGEQLPAAASARRPDLAGAAYEAVSVSLIVHPRNPYVPTTHANLRCFVAEKDGAALDWWFGGGFDLTPYYGFEDDAVHWHQNAREACEPFGEGVYPRLKHWCDEYFYLPHRDEARGVGGLFFDDHRGAGFDDAFGLVRSIGDHFLTGYLPIIERRRNQTYGERERRFQLLRRGRYVEFNLLHDRGTKFGLQASGRVESILASLPPLVRWEYDPQPEPGSPEEALIDFLRPRDWLAMGDA